MCGILGFVTNKIDNSYNKDLITGKIFGKKFKSKIDSNFKNISFKFPGSGISATLNFNENKKNKYIMNERKTWRTNEETIKKKWNKEKKKERKKERQTNLKCKEHRNERTKEIKS